MIGKQQTFRVRTGQRADPNAPILEVGGYSLANKGHSNLFIHKSIIQKRDGTSGPTTATRWTVSELTTGWAAYSGKKGETVAVVIEAALHELNRIGDDAFARKVDLAPKLPQAPGEDWGLRPEDVYKILPDLNGWRKLDTGDSIKLGVEVKWGRNCTFGNFAALENYVKLEDNVSIGRKTTIGSNTYIGSNVCIDEVVKVSNNCYIEHDVTVASYCDIGRFVKLRANSQLAMSVKVGDNVSIGEGSTIKSEAEIAENATLGRQCILGNYTRIGTNAALGNFVHVRTGCEVGRGNTLADCGVWPRTPFHVRGTNHPLNVDVLNGKMVIRVGCCIYTSKEWAKIFRDVGSENGYTDTEITEYKIYLNAAGQWAKLYGPELIELAAEREKECNTNGRR